MTSTKSCVYSVSHEFKVSYKDVSEVQKKMCIEEIGKINIQPRGEILDVGCADGKITKFIADKYQDCSVVGIDISKELIAYAKENHKAKNLKFQLIDLREFKERKKYTQIFSFFVLHWIDNKDKLAALLNILKSLKVGGQFHFIIPLDDPVLFEIRKKGVLKFANLFKGYQVPFVEDKAIVYFRIFNELNQFISFNETKKHEIQHDINLTPLEFKKFFSSFAPELRNCELSDIEQQLYLDWIVEKISKKESGGMNFNFRTITFSGTILK